MEAPPKAPTLPARKRGRPKGSVSREARRNEQRRGAALKGRARRHANLVRESFKFELTMGYGSAQTGAYFIASIVDGSVDFETVRDLQLPPHVRCEIYELALLHKLGKGATSLVRNLMHKKNWRRGVIAVDFRSCAPERWARFDALVLQAVERDGADAYKLAFPEPVLARRRAAAARAAVGALERWKPPSSDYVQEGLVEMAAAYAAGARAKLEELGVDADPLGDAPLAQEPGEAAGAPSAPDPARGPPATVATSAALADLSPPMPGSAPRRTLRARRAPSKLV